MTNQIGSEHSIVVPELDAQECVLQVRLGLEELQCMRTIPHRRVRARRLRRPDAALTQRRERFISEPHGGVRLHKRAVERK